MFATAQFQLLAGQATRIAAGLETANFVTQEGAQAPVAVASILDQVATSFDVAASLQTRAASEMLEAYSLLRRIISTGKNHGDAPALLRGLSNSLQRIAKELEAVQKKEPAISNRNPTIEELKEVLRSRLCFTSKTAAAFSRLTLQGLRGIYILLANSVPPENFLRILGNRAMEAVGGADVVFAQAAQLYDLGVEGFSSAFERYPNYEIQVNYLGGRGYNVSAQLAEHQEAARLAASKDVEGVLCSVRMPIDWSLLSPSQRRYMKRHVWGMLENQRRDFVRKNYQGQQWVEVDLIVRHSKGALRLIEVKNTRNETLMPDSNRLGFLILQGFRHSLLFAQQRFDGVELYLNADDVDRRIVEKLSEAAPVMGVPYSVSVGRQTGRRRLIGSQTPLARVPLDRINPPHRPLPPLPALT